MSFFVAVDLDAPVRDEVAGLISRNAAAVEAKWLPAHKLHVTLQYLGHPKPDALAALEPKLAALARGRAPFTLAFKGAGLFETRRAPAVLWLGVEGDLPALEALQREVALAAGVVEERPFVPHLTLARGRSHGALAEVAQALAHFSTPSFQISALTLYESKDHVYRPVYGVTFS